MSFRLDRCQVPWCRRALHLDYDADTCPGGHVIVCGDCQWRDACDECHPDQPEESAA